MIGVLTLAWAIHVSDHVGIAVGDAGEAAAVPPSPETARTEPAAPRGRPRHEVSLSAQGAVSTHRGHDPEHGHEHGHGPGHEHAHGHHKGHGEHGASEVVEFGLDQALRDLGVAEDFGVTPGEREQAEDPRLVADADDLPVVDSWPVAEERNAEARREAAEKAAQDERFERVFAAAERAAGGAAREGSLLEVGGSANCATGCPDVCTKSEPDPDTCGEDCDASYEEDCCEPCCDEGGECEGACSTCKAKPPSDAEVSVVSNVAKEVEEMNEEAQAYKITCHDWVSVGYRKTKLRDSEGQIVPPCDLVVPGNFRNQITVAKCKGDSTMPYSVGLGKPGRRAQCPSWANMYMSFYEKQIEAWGHVYDKVPAAKNPQVPGTDVENANALPKQDLCVGKTIDQETKEYDWNNIDAGPVRVCAPIREISMVNVPICGENGDEPDQFCIMNHPIQLAEGVGADAPLRSLWRFVNLETVLKDGDLAWLEDGVPNPHISTILVLMQGKKMTPWLVLENLGDPEVKPFHELSIRLVHANKKKVSEQATWFMVNIEGRGTVFRLGRGSNAAAAIKDKHVLYEMIHSKYDWSPYKDEVKESPSYWVMTKGHASDGRIRYSAINADVKDQDFSDAGPLAKDFKAEKGLNLYAGVMCDWKVQELTRERMAKVKPKKDIDLNLDDRLVATLCHRPVMHKEDASIREACEKVADSVKSGGDAGQILGSMRWDSDNGQFIHENAYQHMDPKPSKDFAALPAEVTEDNIEAFTEMCVQREKQISQFWGPSVVGEHHAVLKRSDDVVLAAAFHAVQFWKKHGLPVEEDLKAEEGSGATTLALALLALQL